MKVKIVYNKKEKYRKTNEKIDEKFFFSFLACFNGNFHGTVLNKFGEIKKMIIKQKKIRLTGNRKG